MFRFRKPRALPVPVRRIAEGQRIYAIGDVHGRLDLLSALLQQIKQDNADRASADTIIILLGDMIDRGADSAQVVDLLMTPFPFCRILCLKGNHEDTLLAALTGDRNALAFWLAHGGIEALESWGLDRTLLETAEPSEILGESTRLIPPLVIEWMSKLPSYYRSGDYLFVHAGVRPKISLDEQDERDLLWIREPFLSSKADHGVMVVHGHSIEGEIQHRTNRIGIDTGAYMSGKLTAIGLEGTEIWFLQTG